MKSTQCARILRLSHDGRGIATSPDHRVVFISNALPDETVTYEVVRKHRRYLEGRVQTIDEASSLRVAPICQHFNICGGCSLQHLNKEAELRFKEKVLLEQLREMGKVVPIEVLPPLTAETQGYRRKARLGVRWVEKKNKLLIGFREKSGRYLADLALCPILHERVGLLFDAMRACLLSLSIAHHVPQIEMAMGDQAVAFVFRCLVTPSEADQAILREFGKTHAIDIYIEPNPPALIFQLWNENQPNRLTYTLPEEQLTFLFHPLDFTQIHLTMNRLMVAQALALLQVTNQDRILDLYCGIGNFTLPLAKRAQCVVGVEGSAEMVNRALENAAHNHLNNVTYHAADLAAPKAAPWMQQTYHKLLLDPPRVGAKEILPWVDTWQPEQILYVSCNPATLARDAGLLVNTHKYCLQKVGIMNMFPHTSHVEAMALFRRER